MPANNRFRHQPYGDPKSDKEIVFVRGRVWAPDSPESRLQALRAAESLCRAGVSRVCLVHGTFVGSDALGLMCELHRLLPSIAEPLKALESQIKEYLLNDTGYYTTEYAETMQQLLVDGITGDANTVGRENSPPELPRVDRFTWSSENHHIGRAHAAIRLLDSLKGHHTQPGRTLLWGHSHGGNVLALMTNLLGSEVASLRRFFHAAQPYFQSPIQRRIDFPVWQRVYDLLLSKNRPWDPERLDIMTLGTPVRYGWDEAGYGRLAHCVFHRPVEGVPSYRCRFPPCLDDVTRAAGGDLIQWLGIAGTNFSPPVWTMRTWRADRRLHRVVQDGIRSRDLLARLELGVRVHEEGRMLMIDYEESESHLAQHLAGHAIYTRMQWLPFHLETAATHLYGP